MTQFFGKIILPYLLEQGMQKRLWQGRILDIKLIAKDLIIIISSIGAELFNFSRNKTSWEIDCPTESGIISRDNKFLIITWSDKIHVWDLQKGKLFQEFKSCYFKSNIVFLNDSETIVYGERSGRLNFYNLVSGKLFVKNLGEPDIEFIKLSYDEKLIALVKDSDFSREYFVEIWNLETETKIQQIKLERADIVDKFNLVFTPDNQHIIYAHGETQKVYIYDLEFGKLVQVFEDYTDNLEEMARGAYSSEITIKFSEDGKILSIGNCDLKIRLWNFETKEYLDQIPVGEFNNISSINAISFSPDNKYLASLNYDNQVQLWNIKNKEKIATKQYRKTFHGLEFNVEQKIFASIDFKKFLQDITLWDVDSGKHIKIIDKYIDKYITDIALNHLGTKLLATSYDGIIQLWDIESTEEIISLNLSLKEEHCTSIAISPDERLISATIVNRGNSKVKIWEIKSSNLIHTIEGNQSGKYIIDFNDSCDSKSIIFREDYQYIVELWDNSLVNLPRLLRRINGLGGFVFSPNGALIACCSSRYDAVALYEAASGKPLRIFREKDNFHNSEITSIAFSSDSKLLASSSYDRTIRIWDVATGKQVKLIEGHTSTIFDLFFTDCNNTLISVSADRTVRFWNIESLSQVVK